jgi:HPt (histidine-containing phosphotransfer) domain-containing protein
MTVEMSAPAIDLPTLRALQDSAGALFVAELAATFLEEAPRMLGEMRAALCAGDAETFRRAAHSFKSNSLTFGALGLGAMARDLECGAADTVLAGNGAALDALSGEYARVAAALAELSDA